MATSYYFWGHQRVGLLRGREKMVYWCMPLFLPYFLSLFYHFLSFSMFFLYSYFLLLFCRGLFPLFGLSFSWVPFSRCLLLSYHEFSPLSASLHWVSLFQCFSLFPCFFPPPLDPFFLLWLPSFYNKLIQWDFSLLPFGIHQLFLVCGPDNVDWIKRVLGPICFYLLEPFC